MDYREIIEEQLDILQRKQRRLEYKTSSEEACINAKTIVDLASKLKDIPKFVPEDSNGVCKGGKPCKCHEKEVALEGQVQAQPKKFVPEDSNGKHYEESESCTPDKI